VVGAALQNVQRHRRVNAFKVVALIDGVKKIYPLRNDLNMNRLDQLYEVIGTVIYRNAPDKFSEAFVSADIGGESAGGFQMGAHDIDGNSLEMDLNIQDLLELQKCFVQVRDELLRETGDRLWSIHAAVTKSRGFSIKHGYDMPAWYVEEEDPLVAWEEKTSSSAQITGHLLAWEKSGLSWLQQHTAEDGKAWGLGSETNWAIDLSAGRLTFSFSDGRKVSGQIQVLGTFNKDDGSFLWAWDHPSVPNELRTSAMAMRDWGEANGERDLTQRKVRVDETRLWAWLGFAACESGADGGYRVNSNGTDIYLVYRGMTDLG